MKLKLSKKNNNKENLGAIESNTKFYKRITDSFLNPLFKLGKEELLSLAGKEEKQPTSVRLCIQKINNYMEFIQHEVLLNNKDSEITKAFIKLAEDAVNEGNFHTAYFIYCSLNTQQLKLEILKLSVEWVNKLENLGKIVGPQIDSKKNLKEKVESLKNNQKPVVTPLPNLTQNIIVCNERKNILKSDVERKENEINNLPKETQKHIKQYKENQRYETVKILREINNLNGLPQNVDTMAILFTLKKRLKDMPEKINQYINEYLEKQQSKLNRLIGEKDLLQKELPDDLNYLDEIITKHVNTFLGETKSYNPTWWNKPDHSEESSNDKKVFVEEQRSRENSLSNNR